MNSTEVSLFERVGGRQTINALVDSFYELILNDPELAPFFENINPHKLAGKHIAFMTLAFGGPSIYEHESLRLKHEPLVEKGLNDGHVDLFLKHLREAMALLDFDNDVIEEAIALSNSYRDDVLNR